MDRVAGERGQQKNVPRKVLPLPGACKVLSAFGLGEWFC